MPKAREKARVEGDSWLRCRNLRLLHAVCMWVMGISGGSDGKESACSIGDLGLIPGLGRSSGAGKVYPLQYSGLENSMDCTVHRVTKNQARPSNFHFQYTIV